MQITLGQLRRQIQSTLQPVLSEVYMHGVSQYALTQSTRDYIESIRQHIYRFTLTDKSNTPMQRRQTMAAADEILGDLEKEINKMLASAIEQFTRNS